MSTQLEAFKAAKDALLASFKEKSSELESIRKELVSLGILEGGAPKKERKARKSWPKVDLDAVTAIVKEKGKDGCAAGDLAKHFGQSFAKWRKDNKKDIDKTFSISKDGTSRIWKLK